MAMGFAAHVPETGGSAVWYGVNVALDAGMLREAAAMKTQITGDVIPSQLPGSLAMAVRWPAGVVLGIAPWNAPLWAATHYANVLKLLSAFTLATT